MILEDYDCPNCGKEIDVLDLPDEDYVVFKCPHCFISLWIQSDLNYELDYYFYLSIVEQREKNE